MPEETLTAEEEHDAKHRFLDRRKILSADADAMEVAEQIQAMLAAGQTSDLQELIAEYTPADLADAMRFLDESEEKALFELLNVREAAEVLDEVDTATEAHLLDTTSPQRLADILEELAPDEGADVAGALEAHEAEHVLGLMDPEKADDIRELLAYPPDTAGGIMSTSFVSIPAIATQAEALQIIRETVDADHIFYVYVVDDFGSLAGVLDLRRLITAQPDVPLGEIATPGVVSVNPELDQEQVANIFARYDLLALPVVETGTNKLIGVITADDVIDVIQEESTEDMMHAVGSDANELEKRSPVTVAMMRMPWIMTTLFIELLAGFVIKHFDRTLAQVLLLTSFMPIISAISGNTGLQSATIIVRGLSTGHIRISEWKHAMARQVMTTMILGGACAVTLGVIGALWAHSVGFGVVVALGMFTSVNIAGLVGTAVPMVSKRLGFDPALTAGPFETAFQDVVGISIFLGLATALMHWIK